MFERLYSTGKRVAGNHKSLVKFIGVGSLNTILDFIIFSIFANLLGVYPPLASIISTGLTLILSFFLNHHFVFRSNKKRHAVAVQFIFITLFNVWVIQSAIIALIVHSLSSTSIFSGHIWTLNLVAKLCGVAVSFVLNFIGYRYIFKEKQND